MVWDDRAEPLTGVGCSGCGEVYEEESRDEWCRSMSKSGQHRGCTSTPTRGVGLAVSAGLDTIACKTVLCILHVTARTIKLRKSKEI
jgi:hypothetical protein